MRYLIGLALLAAAITTILHGYGNLPSPSTCQLINTMQRQLGAPATCSAHLAPGYWIATGILTGLALLCWAPLWGRWVAGKPLASDSTEEA